MIFRLSTWCGIGLLVLSATAEAQTLRQKDYSAQRKPRVAVMKFENTNEEAKKRAYGESVSAMLVTFLKRKSQLVVVERQNLDKVLDEWKLQQSGATTDATPGQQVLESIEAILDGRVTVLGDELEIDARLISKDDAHIISAGHRSGASSKLRETVERLGAELENGFLRPYYGSLRVTVTEPTNTRVFLTPILSVSASDDEKPPLELDHSVSPSAREIVYDKWLTDPLTGMISNLLPGWYTVRLEHPGYESIGLGGGDNARIVLQDSLGDPAVTALGGGALPPEQREFLVRINASQTTVWPADNKRIALRRRTGSLRVMVRREFIDRDYRDATDLPELKTYVRAQTLKDLNPNSRPDPNAPRSSNVALLEMNSTSDLSGTGDATLVVPRGMDIPDGCTIGKSLDSLDQFTGGRLLIEDYHRLTGPDKRLPIGPYLVAAQVPNYDAYQTTRAVEVVDQADDRVVQVDLKRMMGEVRLTFNGPAMPGRSIFLVGAETKRKYAISLSGLEPKPDILKAGYPVLLPVDTYVVTSDVPGFEKWQTTVLSDARLDLPRVNDKECQLDAAVKRSSTTRVEVKAQPWIGGRWEEMSRMPDMKAWAAAGIVAQRADVGMLLSRVMDDEEKKQTSARPSAAAGQSLLVSGPGTSNESGASYALTQLKSSLKSIDLLYLDDAELRRLSKLPVAAAAVHEYIVNGGAVFCFLSQPADVTPVLGAAVPLAPQPDTHGEWELRPGDVPQLQLDVKLDFKSSRAFPTLALKQALTEWRVLAYRRKGRRDPVVIERGDVQGSLGGYVVVWLDAPDMVPTVPLADQTFTAVENRAFLWAQYLMHHRLGPGTEPEKTALDKLSSLSFTARGEGKIETPR